MSADLPVHSDRRDQDAPPRFYDPQAQGAACLDSKCWRQLTLRGDGSLSIKLEDKITNADTVVAGNEVRLKNPSIVRIPYHHRDIESSERHGNDLVVTLKSGEHVIIHKFFVDKDGQESELVLLDDDSG
ncbi:hypothetical protein DLM19_24085, partial [Salmonella enterica subsp. enterica serovar Agona]|nr:hypothetical protein [Salmonella enterica subsp. enterica serovar Agona]